MNYITCIVLFLCCCLAGCKPKTQPFVIPPPSLLKTIEQRGVLRVCAYANATDYYVHRGVTKGFHYELLKGFADFLGVKLQMETRTHFDQAIQELSEGTFDLVAMNLVVTSNRREQVWFSNPLFYTQRVLVQHKKNASRVDSIPRLEGKKIVIQSGTSTNDFLEQLRDSLGIAFEIVELEEKTYEDIMLMVENHEVEYTVTEQHLAQIAARYMPGIDYSVTLSESLPVAWAIPKDALDLQRVINDWIAKTKQNELFYVLFNRYFKNRSASSFKRSIYYTLKEGIISDFDAFIKKESSSIGWDWRLLAALIYHESRFEPDIVSPFGAVGLMQVMPNTAEGLGFKDYQDPLQNIRAGNAYLKYLHRFFADYPFEPEERVKFILAAYNAGPGHVLDAMRLAEANQKDPYTWNQHVDYYLLNKSKPEYYRDPVVKYGYCDGRQTYHFVHNIIETYAHYKNIIPE